jgi:DNA-binding response OmpR family regulator
MKTKLKILVIEDDAAIRRGIVDALKFAGYAILEAGDGERGMEMAVRVDCDLILLDLILPGQSGVDILDKVREVRPTLPVIVLTALGAEEERVRGLKAGADDYVVKPFSVKELLARVEAVLRRTPERPVDRETIAIPGGLVDMERREVRFDDGRRAEISEREAELLRYLARNTGRAISREEILSNVWRIDPKGVVTRTIDMHIARLREKLGDASGEPSVIVTVRGKGYKLGVAEASP